jgi:hypothetical protein
VGLDGTPGGLRAFGPTLEMFEAHFVPFLGLAQFEREFLFVLDVSLRSYDVIGERQLRSDRIGIDQTPVLEVGIAIGEENIDEQAPRELLYVSEQRDEDAAE